MTKEERAKYNAKYRKENELHIRNLKRKLYLGIRSAKREVLETRKKNVKVEVEYCDREIERIESLLLTKNLSLIEFENAISRRNALIAKEKIMKQRINKHVYMYNISIIR